MVVVVAALAWVDCAVRLRPRRTEDYHQNGYENHPTITYSCRDRGLKRHTTLNFGLAEPIALVVDRTPLVWVQSFRAKGI